MDFCTNFDFFKGCIKIAFVLTSEHLDTPLNFYLWQVPHPQPHLVPALSETSTENQFLHASIPNDPRERTRKNAFRARPTGACTVDKRSAFLVVTGLTQDP